MTDDLRDLAHDLTEAPRRMQRASVGIVEHAAVNVKNGWRDNAEQSAGEHARQYPASIGYDLSLGAALAGFVAADVGPDKDRPQGALGNVLEFGSPTSPPHNDGGRAAAAEAPNLERALAGAALDALGWR